MKKKIRNRNDNFIIHNSSFIMRSKSGFTLIEILVALAILSVLLTAIYSTFFLAQRAVSGMDESLVKLQEARRALDILRCELDAAFFQEDVANTRFQLKDRDYYGKSASELTFATFSVLRPGISKVSYYVEEHDGRLHLFKKIEPLRQTRDEVEGVEIIENLNSFSIEAKYEDRWVRTWDADINKNTPGELKVSVEFKVKERTITLSDTAKPRIGRPI